MPKQSNKSVSDRRFGGPQLLIVVFAVVFSFAFLCVFVPSNFEKAASDGNDTRVNMYLLLGLPPDMSESDMGFTPLMAAAESGHVSVVRELIAAGANVNSATTWGDTPLISSSISNEPQIARLLLQKGAHVNAQTNDGAMTALTAAVSNGLLENVRLLLAYHADVNQKAQEGKPLKIAQDWLRTEKNPASAVQRKQIVELLKKAGATD